MGNFRYTSWLLMLMITSIYNLPYGQRSSTDEKIAADQVNSPGGGLGGDR